MKSEFFIWFIVGIAIGMMAGLYLGFVIQQMIFIAGMVEFGESLEGTDIEVNIDLNETKLIEGFKETFIPIFNQTINKSGGNLKENENNKT